MNTHLLSQDDASPVLICLGVLFCVLAIPLLSPMLRPVVRYGRPVWIYIAWRIVRTVLDAARSWFI
jgi:hypothetical protein